jgi:hypothetical protein
MVAVNNFQFSTREILEYIGHEDYIRLRLEGNRITLDSLF